MPRGKKPQGGSSGEERRGQRSGSKGEEKQFGGFLNLNLTDIEKEDFARWEVESATGVWEELTQCLDGGLKMSITFDSEGDCYIASFSGVLIPAQENTTYVTSARAGTWERAIKLLMYKHVVLADCDWSNYKPRSGRMSEV